MPSYTSPSQSHLLINEKSSYLLDIYGDGLTLSCDGKPLFTLKESILLAQGTLDDAQQVHLVYIKNSGEFCYSVILPTGHHQTMPLGKLDIQNQRYNRLLLFPVGKVIHIFYASSHYGLPDVWRITHLFWNGQTWKSAQLGEVVHPRYPLYHVLLDSRSNLHVLMMTFLGNRSVMLASMFNGTFYLWSKRQEVLSIPREVVDMTALITPQDEGHIFWAARQPASDRFEIGHGVQGKINDFRSSWRIDAPPAVNLEGPWRGLGVLQSQGIISLLVSIKQNVIFQVQDKSWKPVLALSGDFSPLYISHKSEANTHYTAWLSQENPGIPLFAQELSIPCDSSEVSPQVSASLTSQESIPQQVTSVSIASAEQVNPEPSVPPEPTEALAISDSTETLAASEYTESRSVLENSDSLTIPEHTESLVAPEHTGLAAPEKISSEEPTPYPTDSPNLQDLTAIQSSTPDLIHVFSELKDNTTTMTDKLEVLSLKLDSLPEIVELFKELIAKNERTLDSLQNLENKINNLQTTREVATKKGFWQKWLT